MDQDDNMRSADYLALLKQYVDLCEEIVTSSEAQSPFHSVWKAYQKRLGAHEVPIDVMVYDDTPCVKATMKLIDGDIVLPSELSDGCAQWRVTASYLKKVLNDPDYYKKNPAQLDWSWLQEVV